MITNEQIIEQVNKKIKNNPVFYVTRDKERGAGIEDLLKNYKIITTSPPKDTAEIIDKKLFPLKSNIIVFKNNARIQRICKEKGLKLLNSDYSLGEKFENKISQFNWLKTIIPNNLPKTIIATPEQTSFGKIIQKVNSPFVLQFNYGHSGEGTFLISKEKQFLKIKEKFPQREIKCLEFIKNPTITLNVCVWPAKGADKPNCILIGNPSVQITGLKHLTDFRFSTVGNDWSLANKILKQEDLKQINKLSEIIGQEMKKQGWRGLFGLDIIKKKKKWLVIEINARQPASTGLETKIQRRTGNGINIFTAHLAALLKLPLPDSCFEIKKSFQKIRNGGQIIKKIFFAGY